MIKNIFNINVIPKLASISLLLLAAVSVNTAAVTLYKWVDSEGNVSYQDQPPPRGEKYEEKSFSDEGVRTGDSNAEVARDRAILENPVTLYVAENCESCNLVGEILKSRNIPYRTISADNDTQAQKQLIKLVGSVRVPTLAIGEKAINETNRSAIEDALKDGGYPLEPGGAE